MNKKILLAVLAATLTIVTLPTSKAEEVKPPTLAIIDTALNSNMPEIKNNIVYEACVIEWPSCPNQTGMQEGPGSASLPLNIITKNGFDHGTNMVSVAIATNPNVKIVFVRYVGATANGSRQITTEFGFIKALDWVIANKDRFNIKAVAMSQGHHNLPNVVDYCPKTASTEFKIGALIRSGVQVFLPAGNSRDLKRMDWPACIPSSFSVAASSYGDGPALYTNYDANMTDIFASGDAKVLFPDGRRANSVGTSIANQVAASSYLALATKYPTYTFEQLTSMLKLKTTPLVSRNIKNARVLDISAVLNG